MSEVRRRRVGRFARVALVSGLDGFQGKEEEDHDYSPGTSGSFRRTDDANKDELGGGHQRRANEARPSIDEDCDDIVQPQTDVH